MMNDYLLVAALLLLVLAIVGYVRLYCHYRRNIRKVTFLFDAIDNVDFTFCFPTEGKSKSEQLVNRSLNRIKNILLSARREQMERERYYEQILNAVDTGILVADERGHVLQYNHQALRLLHTDTVTHLRQVQQRLNDNNLSRHETHTTLKDKPVRIIAISDVRHELNNQEVDSWIKLIRVLTHEIMNTITPVTSLSETLLDKAPEDSDLHTALETIHTTGKELLSFVNNYRRFTHVPTPQPKLFYVEPFLQRMATLCSHEATVAVTSKDLIAYADESLMAHVVTNLLKNAAEAIAALPADQQTDKFISTKAYTDEHEAVCIEVTDNAGLIPDDVASHIFVPFFTTKKEGSGIGLSLSRQIMRVSGGSLSLHQDTASGTTSFLVVIP